MKIGEMYQAMCEFYGMREMPNISDYLLTTPRESFQQKIIGNISREREALYIREGSEGPELGLYIAPSIVNLLESCDELEHLDEFACAVEGVSHFLYICDRIGKARSVSCLELELQGEVDKFIVIHLLASSRMRSISKDFFRRQFDGCSYDGALSPAELDTYNTASHFAAKYCAHLMDECFNPLRYERLSQEARDFFNMGLSDKVRKLIP